ncbi:MAG: metallophosphoesterase [Actinomycetota bacterium]|nr:metallophosphatase family protein [Actinomycetota bacterium]
MKTAVLSDVHANLEALDAVLDEADCDAVIVLGDIIGYNADPQAVIDRLTGMQARCIAGNHDLALTGRFNVDWFNDVAADAIRWTAGQVDDSAFETLGRLEPVERTGSQVLVHGSVRDPAAEYLRNAAAAAVSFSAADFSVAFFGHTHIPAAYAREDERVRELFLSPEGETLELRADVRYLLNPGSVGQPRDGDPRASYLILDGDRVQWRRVPYDVAETQRKIRATDLPPVLADRLSVGR